MSYATVLRQSFFLIWARAYSAGMEPEWGKGQLQDFTVLQVIPHRAIPSRPRSQSCLLGLEPSTVRKVAKVLRTVSAQHGDRPANQTFPVPKARFSGRRWQRSKSEHLVLALGMEQRLSSRAKGRTLLKPQDLSGGVVASQLH